MLFKKPLPNFCKAVLFVAITSASASAFAAHHGEAAEAAAAKDAIKHAQQDETPMLKHDSVKADDKIDNALDSEGLSTDEMIKELKEKADSVNTE